MTERKSAIAASVKEASRGKAAFVFASSASSLPQTSEALAAKLSETKYSRFGCKACSTEMHARSDVTPFCITCGAGDEVQPMEHDAKPEVSAKTDLVALTCETCDTSTVVEAAVAKAITASSKEGPTPIHCSCCGNPMVAENLEQDGEPKKMEDQNIGQPDMKAPDVPPTPSVADAVPAVPGAQDGAADDELTLDMDDDVDSDLDLDSLSAFGDDGADEFGQSEDQSSDPVEGDGSTLNTPNGPTVLEDFAKPEPTDGAGDAFSLELDPAPVEDFSSPVVDVEEDLSFDNTLEEVPVLSSEDEGEPLVDALEMDDTDTAVAFVRANGRLVAMKGHVTIASLSAKSKTQNAKLINSDALVAASYSSIRQEGLRAGLASIGFSMVKVPASAAMKAAVERRANEITAKSSATDVEKQKVFAESFAIASVGLSRGQWKGVQNPLRAAMESELSRLGVETPRRVVSSIFNSVGVDYAQTLLKTATKLTQMSASARAELQTVLNMTTAVDPVDEHDSEAEDIEVGPIEARISKAGVTAAVKPVPALLQPRQGSNPVAIQSATAVLAGSAPLTFNV